MGLTVEEGRVVAIRYTLRDADGAVVESNTGKDDAALEYVHGGGEIVAGLERALAGCVAKEQLEVEVPPAEGYGEVLDGLKLKLGPVELEALGEMEIGTTVRADTPAGMHLFRVVALGDGGAVLDGNHPLAGRTLYFEVRVESVREATEGERGLGLAG